MGGLWCGDQWLAGARISSTNLSHPLNISLLGRSFSSGFALKRRHDPNERILYKFVLLFDPISLNKSVFPLPNPIKQFQQDNRRLNAGKKKKIPFFSQEN